MISRRTLLPGLLLAAPTLLSLPAAADTGNADLQHRFASLERKHGGHLGVAVLDTAKANPATYRGNERFPLCSTYKCLAAACVLARVDRKEDNLARRIVYTKAGLVPYSPVTEKHVGEPGLTIAELCDAAVTLSDNTAGNLLLDSFGGPAALTAYLRSLGDAVTRLDRREPELNEAKPGDLRDTTTPLAMLETLRKIVLGTALSPSSREQLTAWLVADKVGDQRLHAGLPDGWRIGDKTGSGARNATNDVAVIWPPSRPPILVTVYYIDSPASAKARNAVLAEIGRLTAAA